MSDETQEPKTPNPEPGMPVVEPREIVLFTLPIEDGREGFLVQYVSNGQGVLQILMNIPSKEAFTPMVLDQIQKIANGVLKPVRVVRYVRAETIAIVPPKMILPANRIPPALRG